MYIDHKKFNTMSNNSIIEDNIHINSDITVRVIIYDIS